MTERATARHRDSLFVQAVFGSVMMVATLVWAVVGFIFWIPLLLRTTVIFTAVLLATALNDSRGDVDRARAGVEFAVSFYPGGFAHIFGALRRRGEPNGERRGTASWSRVALECVWAALAWTMIGLSLGLVSLETAWEAVWPS